MQDCKIAVEEFRDLLGNISQRIGNAFARPKTREDNEVTNCFMFQLIGPEMILERFQVWPEEAIYIGDSVIDKEHCASVGIELIAFKNKTLEARYHVDNFMSIVNLPPFQGNGPVDKQVGG